MNELLERIQRERNSDVPFLQKLELVDLNKFDTPINIEENENMLEKEDENIATKKTKILNIEELINGLSSSAATKKFITNENNSEFNSNLNIKLDFLNKQLEKVLSNQKLIMAKLNI